MVNILKKYDFKNRSGFSMPEMLIVLVIIGIICVLTLTTYKPNDHILYLQYQKALRTVELIAFNDYAKYNQENDINSRSNPNASKVYLEDMSMSQLCTRWAEYVNTKNVSCNAATPSFTTTSDMLFQFELNNSINTEIVKKVIIWVDVNGNRKPNTRNWTQKVPSDRVPFIVNSLGDVSVVGPPRFDRRYIQARTVYDTKDDQDLPTRSPKMLYAQAQAIAFGKYEFDLDSYSYKYDEIFGTYGHASVDNLSDDIADGCIDENQKDNPQEKIQFPRCTVELMYN